MEIENIASDLTKTLVAEAGKQSDETLVVSQPANELAEANAGNLYAIIIFICHCF